MLIKSFLMSLIWLSGVVYGHIDHTENGTEYGDKGVSMYTKSNHGPDGKIFLDPYFTKELTNLNNQRILDA